MKQDAFHQNPRMASSGNSFTVKNTLVQVVGYGCLILFTALAIGSLTSGEFSSAGICLVFVALGAYLVLYSGQLTLDSEGVTYTTRMAKYQMKWEEVKTIEVDGQDNALVFCGANRTRRIAPYGPFYWSGPEKQNLQILLADEIRRRQIEVKRSMRAMFSVSRNTKVS